MARIPDQSVGPVPTVASELPPSASSEAEKRVTWAELFFDLVFVVAVTRVSSMLGTDHSPAGLLRALVVFVPVYWLWVGTAVHTNLRDVNQPMRRLQLFTVALSGIFLALSLPDAYGRLGLLFAVAYWLGRLVLGWESINTALRTRTWPVNPLTVSVAVTGPLLALGATVHGNTRVVLWIAAALIDLSTPTLLRSRLISTRYDAGHLSERFGLFLLIAMGESVVSTATSANPDALTPERGLAVATAFAVTCALWWVYFHFAADAMRHSLATARVQLDITRLVLSYGHLLLIAAVIAVAVGLRQSIAHPAGRPSWELIGLLFGGTAMYLASFGFTRWAMFRLVSWTRLGAAGVIVVLLPLGRHLPAVAALAVLATVLAALNAIEFRRNARTGWRARGR